MEDDPDVDRLLEVEEDPVEEDPDVDRLLEVEDDSDVVARRLFRCSCWKWKRIRWRRIRTSLVDDPDVVAGRRSGRCWKMIRT